MSGELKFLVERIQEGVRRQGRYLITAPSEKALLRSVDDALALARRQGWMLVCHLGGEYFEFFEATRSPQQALW